MPSCKSLPLGLEQTECQDPIAVRKSCIRFLSWGGGRIPAIQLLRTWRRSYKEKRRFYILLTAHTSLEGRGHVKAELRIYEAAKRTCQEKEKRREKEEKDGKDG